MDKATGLFQLRKPPFDPPGEFLGMGASDEKFASLVVHNTIMDVISGGWTEEELIFLMSNEVNPVASFYGYHAFFIACPDIHRAIKTIFRGAKNSVLLRVNSNEKELYNRQEIIDAALDFIKRGGKIEMFVCKDAEEIAYGIWKSSRFVTELGQALTIHNMSSVEPYSKKGLMVVDDKHILMIEEYVDHQKIYGHPSFGHFGLHCIDIVEIEKNLRSLTV